MSSVGLETHVQDSSALHYAYIEQTVAKVFAEHLLGTILCTFNR